MRNLLTALLATTLLFPLGLGESPDPVAMLPAEPNAGQEEPRGGGNTPPGLGTLDPWLDAQGDFLFGPLQIGGQELRFRDVTVASKDPETLQVTGNLTVNGTLRVAPVERHYNLRATAFTPASHLAVFGKDKDKLVGFSPGQSNVFFAPVHLPQGARITGIQAEVRDDSPVRHIDVLLSRQGGGAPTSAFMALVATTDGGTPGLTTLSSDEVSDPIVDNSVYGYHIEAFWVTPADNFDIGLHQVIISYEVADPLQ